MIFLYPCHGINIAMDLSQVINMLEIMTLKPNDDNISDWDVVFSWSNYYGDRIECSVIQNQTKMCLLSVHHSEDSESDTMVDDNDDDNMIIVDDNND